MTERDRIFRVQLIAIDPPGLDSASLILGDVELGRVHSLEEAATALFWAQAAADRLALVDPANIPAK